jgi:hypothetical protein
LERLFGKQEPLKRYHKSANDGIIRHFPSTTGPLIAQLFLSMPARTGHLLFSFFLSFIVSFLFSFFLFFFLFFFCFNFTVAGRIQLTKQEMLAKEAIYGTIAQAAAHLSDYVSPTQVAASVRADLAA